MCRICTVQVQPSQHVRDHAGYTAPTRQHQLDHTDHTDHTDQEYTYLPCLADPDNELYCCSGNRLSALAGRYR